MERLDEITKQIMDDDYLDQYVAAKIARDKDNIAPPNKKLPVNTRKKYNDLISEYDALVQEEKHLKKLIINIP